MPPKQAESKKLPKTVSRWGQERRLEFIEFRLRWEGRLNRGDLMSFFGISVPQASLDISRYRELAPRNLVYDPSARVYVATPDFEPVFPSSSASRFLNEVLARASGILEPEGSLIGWMPPIGATPVPGRAVDGQVLFHLLRGIRERLAVQVRYHSMQRPDPSVRVLSPHAIAHDGFRWHVRAFCHTRNEFRDFVIARILEAAPSSEAAHPSDSDHKWHATVELVLAPHPKLPKPHQRAIELDYGMVNGTVGLICRQALAFYVLKHLGLDEEVERRPEVQQVVLKNRREVEKAISTPEFA